MTYYSADSNANWANMQDAVGKKLTEKTGITIQAEYAVDGSNQKLPLMVASGNIRTWYLPRVTPICLWIPERLLI